MRNCQRQRPVLKKGSAEDGDRLPSSRYRPPKKTAIMSFWQSQAEKGCQHNHQTAVVQKLHTPLTFLNFMGGVCGAGFHKMAFPKNMIPYPTLILDV